MLSEERNLEIAESIRKTGNRLVFHAFAFPGAVLLYLCLPFHSVAAVITGIYGLVLMIRAIKTGIGLNTMSEEMFSTDTPEEPSSETSG